MELLASALEASASEALLRVRAPLASARASGAVQLGPLGPSEVLAVEPAVPVEHQLGASSVLRRRRLHLALRQRLPLVLHQPRHLEVVPWY